MTQANTKEVRFTMRMKSDIYNALKENAEKNKRSICKELEFQSEKYMEAKNA